MRRSRLLVLACSTAVLCGCEGRGASRPPANSEACGEARRGGVRCIAVLPAAALYGPIAAEVSPDGQRYVYEVVDGPDIHLVLYDARSRQLRMLTRGEGRRTEPAWSPDGRRIAFTRWDRFGSSRFRRRDGIGVVDAAGGSEHLAYASDDMAIAMFPSWTPDGRIVFTQQRLQVEVDAVAPHLPAASVDTTTAPSVLPGAAEPPPTGSEEPGAEAWVVNVSGRHARRYFARGVRGRVRVSPRGDQVAWVGAGCGGEGLVVADTGGARVRCVAEVQPDVFTWSADGRDLLYLAAEDDQSPRRAWAVSAAGGTPRPLPVGDGDVTGIAVARDGTVSVSVYRPRARIATLPATGGEPRPLLHGWELNAFWPEWAGDGRTLVFAAGPWQPRWRSGLRLYRVGLGADGRASSLPTPIAARGADPTAGEPQLTAASFGPGGALAVQVESGGGSAFSVVTPPDSALAFAGWADADNAPGPPAWTPNGRMLLMASGEMHWDSGHVAKYPAWSLILNGALAPLQGSPASTRYGRRLRLDGFRGRPVLPRFSPDGRWVAFATRKEGGRTEIYRVPGAGGRVQRLASIPGAETLTGPEWSPDGRWIYFSAPDSAGISRIVRVPAAGGAAQTLSRGPGHAVHPRLSPDGRTLAVTAWEGGTQLWTISPAALAAGRPAVPPANGRAGPSPPGAAHPRG